MLLVPALGLILLLLALAAAGAARLPAARAIVYGGSSAACLALLGIAAARLGLGDAGPNAISLPLGLPWLRAHFELDALSAVFLAVVNLGGAMASIYGLGHGRHEREPARVLPFFPAFLAGMNLVLLAADAFTFLVSWEFMSLSSWALVVAHHRDKANLSAGFVYLVMASFGTLALLLAFGLMAGPGGDYDFDSIRRIGLGPAASAAVLALVLTGAGSKAGLVPLHAWLPLAHPAAPSHVSALMSGVMTKVAVYAVVRIVFDLIGQPQWWWGGIVLALGGLTAVMGVLYALMEHDLKRLLAYHTVENIGIIFIGLGLALAFRANGLATAAALALTAALFHVFNHSVFKSLLFFGAGAVQTATGERDMERLGGLMSRMPQTAFVFLVGSAAISALPPLNGFVSEWMTLQAILISPELPQWALKFLVPAVGALLALSAALAAACFVKAFGITFLGRARTAAATGAKETDRFSLAAMYALALICLFAGVVPGAIIDLLAPAVRMLTGSALPAAGGANWLLLVPVAFGRSSYSGPILFSLIVFAGAATAFVINAIGARNLRRAPAWDCGFPDPSPSTQYTADSFAQPIRRVFGSVVFQARETVEMPPPGDMGAARFQVRLRDFAWEWFYEPVGGSVSYAADWLNRVQFLTIRRYLALVFAALIVLLCVVAIWR